MLIRMYICMKVNLFYWSVEMLIKKHWYVCNSMYALHSRAVAFTLNFLSHNFLMCTWFVSSACRCIRRISPIRSYLFAKRYADFSWPIKMWQDMRNSTLWIRLTRLSSTVFTSGSLQLQAELTAIDRISSISRVCMPLFEVMQLISFSTSAMRWLLARNLADAPNTFTSGSL